MVNFLQNYHKRNPTDHLYNLYQNKLEIKKKKNHEPTTLVSQYSAAPEYSQESL